MPEVHFWYICLGTLYVLSESILTFVLSQPPFWVESFSFLYFVSSVSGAIPWGNKVLRNILSDGFDRDKFFRNTYLLSEKLLAVE